MRSGLVIVSQSMAESADGQEGQKNEQGNSRPARVGKQERDEIRGKARNIENQSPRRREPSQKNESQKRAVVSPEE